MANCVIYNVGCFTHCEDVVTGLVATQTGIHTLTYDWQSMRNTFDFFVNFDEVITFCDTPFNEMSTIVFTIKNPDGTQYSTTIDSVEYSKFTLEIKLAFDRTPIKTNEDLLCIDCDVE